MVESDRPRFQKLVEALAAGFRVEATFALYEAYWLGLEDLPLDAVKKAAGLALRGEKFMPTPAELRKLAGEMPAADRALRAWEAVHRAVRSHGHTHSVDFADGGVTNASIRMLGGWHWLCSQESTQFPFIRKDFLRVYESIADRGCGDDQRAPLLSMYPGDAVRVQVDGATEPPKALPPAPAPNGTPPLGPLETKLRDYVAGLVKPVEGE